jgi:hypothetical protein
VPGAAALAEPPAPLDRIASMVQPRPRLRVWRSRVIAPALAAGLALLVILTGAEGVDLAAATYRIELFARNGLTLWDSGWYGGHWTFDYSVLFAPIGWLAGIPLMEIVCVAVASWAFDRLAVARFGRAGRAGAIAFAIGTVVQVAIGQEPYLLGETLALVALVAAQARRWQLSLPLAVATSLASPLAGGFLGLAAIAWAIGIWPRRRWDVIALAVAALAPVAALELLFPGQGMMPFEAINFVGMVISLILIGAVVMRRDRALLAGVVLYSAAVVFAYAVPSALGNNITRLGVCFGIALIVALAAGSDRRARLALVGAAIPLLLAQWLPAGQSLLGWGNASESASYFGPLLGFLRHNESPLGRVEVVPTATHWEAAYVAPYFPLARGWERQLDTAENAIFYVPGKLTPASYRTWLYANGVRFVALPENVPLDYAAAAEARLVRRGMPGLRPVWHSGYWRVYAVEGAPGLVSGPARLLASPAGSDVLIEVERPGTIIVRERYVAAWQVARGHATVGEAPGGWVRVRAARAGVVELRIAL